ncbi:hypothetical protein BST81_00370 [Leptolyngbya sp. 'hensonii']|uniref:variant leucine-rich repeat-containing protein n=1 Tax=Leptolyngbya sp. 'hensonii' TaxID=1922337 RepID=UPI0009500163|nr:hypothetical protein [Leptolyngbya sp. 'hensonii']OLP20235.1 hypothetical protein BST81_00370 [Leptolyngbya sp. 'hensonii']
MYPTREQQAADATTSPKLLRSLAHQSFELACLVAQNPGTPPDLLRELGLGCPPVRQIIIENPKTPRDILFNLGAEFPRQLLHNPVFSLLWLEHPNLIDEIPVATLMSLLGLPEIPISLVERAVQRYQKLPHAGSQSNWQKWREEAQQVLGAIVQNPGTPAPILQQIAEGPLGKYFRLQLFSHPHVTRGILDQLPRIFELELTDDPDFYMLLNSRFSPYAHLSGNALDWIFDQVSDLRFSLKKHHSPDRSLTYCRLIEHPNTSEQTLEKLALLEQNAVFYPSLDWTAIRRSLAQHPHTSASILAQLIESEPGQQVDLILWERIAQHPQASPQILQEIMYHPAVPAQLKNLVMTHPNAPSSP